MASDVSRRCACRSRPHLHAGPGPRQATLLGDRRRQRAAQQGDRRRQRVRARSRHSTRTACSHETTYEIMRPESGAAGTRLVLGKHPGMRGSTCAAARSVIGCASPSWSACMRGSRRRRIAPRRWMTISSPRSFAKKCRRCRYCRRRSSAWRCDMSLKVALLPGDGSVPKSRRKRSACSRPWRAVGQDLYVYDSLDRRFGHRRNGTGCLEDTLEACLNAKAVLLGAVAIRV